MELPEHSLGLLAERSTDHRIRFLSRLAFELTIAARSAYIGSDNDAGTELLALRPCNEVLHRVTAQLDHELSGTPPARMYPYQMLGDIIQEIAEAGGAASSLTTALRRTESSLLGPS